MTQNMTQKSNRPRLNSPRLGDMGWTDSAEMLNGRLAMLGFVIAIATELLTGQGVIGQIRSFWPAGFGNM
jgi:hypothetical protein